jgi:hypothetical protein
MSNNSIIENVTDRISGETVAFERKICGVCQRPVYKPEGHSECMRDVQERENVMANVWQQKRKEAIGKSEQWKRDNPTPEEIHEKQLVEQAAQWKRESELQRRKERLADLEAEAANLRRILDEETQ